MTAPPQLAHAWHTPARGPTVSYHSPMARKLRKISPSPLKVKAAKLPPKNGAAHSRKLRLLAVSDSRSFPRFAPTAAKRRPSHLSPFPGECNRHSRQADPARRRQLPPGAAAPRRPTTLGEAFSFISGLYFRGKLAYARAFAQPPPHKRRVMVITACGGLLPAGTLLTREDLSKISSASVSLSDVRYRIPLERDARLLAEHRNDTARSFSSAASPRPNMSTLC